MGFAIREAPERYLGRRWYSGHTPALRVKPYNGHAFPVDLSDISGMDKRHFGIVLELMTSYHTLGENDKATLKLAERIKKEFRGDK